MVGCNWICTKAVVRFLVWPLYFLSRREFFQTVPVFAMMSGGCKLSLVQVSGGGGGRGKVS